MTTPRVSVVLPVYNGENYLRVAIDSVLAQTLPDVELIVVDDGSRDGTRSIVDSYGDSVRYVHQENAGVAAAVNHGIRESRGQYISWLSHDDAFLPAKLERQVAALERAGEPAVCYTDAAMIDAAGNVTREVHLPEYPRGGAVPALLTGGEIGFAAYSICYDRRCIDIVGPYSRQWPYTQDAEMLLRMARRFPMLRVPEVLVRIREHAARESLSRKWHDEVVVFYRQHIATTPFREAFPDAPANPSRRQRAARYEALGDTLAAQWSPLNRVAESQYWRAVREWPPSGAGALRKLFRAWRARRRT